MKSTWIIECKSVKRGRHWSPSVLEVPCSTRRQAEMRLDQIRALNISGLEFRVREYRPVAA